MVNVMLRTRVKMFAVAAGLTACATTSAVTRGPAGQAQIQAPENKYSPADDVKLGREAAAEVEKQLPVMRDSQVNDYLNAVGRRLVENIPAQFRHSEFHYTFTGVNLKEINAFALPGGPMFVYRGMLDKARNEGEVAGVMAHELSHVALRHGTAQQTKAAPYAIGQVAGQILGSIIGGGWGQVISQGSQFGLGAAFLRYSRDYEKQADLLGARIMASAGYDPRDMANVFKTIEQESGPGGPEWLSDHPNPGNRYEYINQEAQALRVANPTHNTPAFQSVQAHLNTLPPAPSTEEVARKANAGRSTNGGAADSRPTPGSVAPPASRSTTYSEGNLFRVSVPSNWQELPSNNSVTFAPQGAYGTVGGNSVFTHGIQIGVSPNETHDLKTATDELIQSLRQGNPRLGTARSYDRATLGGRQALHAVLSNVSDATGQPEMVDLSAAMLSDGSLFYAVGVAPRDDYDRYTGVFRNVLRSIQFTR